MFIPLRVGDSFVADVNNFAPGRHLRRRQRTSLVVQEALGTLNNSQLARQAVEYAYDHGVAVIASAADEAAQHHNWPSNYPHTIVVNSVNKYDERSRRCRVPPQFNGCTNFSTQDHARDPEHELLLRRHRRRLRARRPGLQRGAERARRAATSTRTRTARCVERRPLRR